MKLTMLPNAPPICWGRPDSVRRELCALCHGALPEVPIIMWSDEGYTACFCDDCFEKWFTVKK